MSGEKVVTHADLSELFLAQESVHVDTSLSAATADKVHALLQRLIAAAEADAPPLPEGWVLFSEGGHWHPYYHERGHLYTGADVDGGCLHVARVGEGRFDRDRLTPLRPTVTEDDVEKVAYAIFREHDKSSEVDFVGVPRRTSLAAARAVLDVLGIEVTDDAEVAR